MRHNTPSGRLVDFIRESNRIENIHREPNAVEIAAHQRLLALHELTVADVEEFVHDVAGARIRAFLGMNVRVGGHVPIPGGPEVPMRLQTLLTKINSRTIAPYEAHVEYETLHPALDGNGRSGRCIWLWHMAQRGFQDDALDLGFLHSWYYQSLGASR